MKETILSSSEKSFILTALSENRRLDGRKLDEFRKLKIHFGSDWGCCLVTLGETKVIAQASCEVQQPKPTRPNEGLLFLYVELSPMGAPHFESGRQSDLAVQLNRLLEKCIKDSRCVDLESLCITAEEKVWAVRIDINILNHEGNLVDAASVAALTALSHFRRPDVTTTGEQTIIHDPAERDPIPITLHHHPVCISYAVFDKGAYVVADPTTIEERVSEGQIVFGVNAYRELCGLHLGGKAPVTTQMVHKYASVAAKRALEVVTEMKNSLAHDLENRKSGIEVGFAECIEGENRLSLGRDSFRIQLHSEGFREEIKSRMKGKFMTEEKSSDDNMSENDEAADTSVIVPLSKGTAALATHEQQSIKLEKSQMLQRKQETDEESEDSSSESSASENIHVFTSKALTQADETRDPVSDTEVQVVAEFKGAESKSKKSKVIADIELSGDSEEEETVMLHGDDLKEVPTKKQVERKQKQEKDKESKDMLSRGWYSKPMW